MSEFETILEPVSNTCPRGPPYAQAHKCEDVLNIGSFFDGTDNNKSSHKDPSTNPNVARLWQAYRHSPGDGDSSIYVSGAGTPFTELGKKKAGGGGGIAGAGG